jgi:hypothetical protein
MARFVMSFVLVLGVTLCCGAETSPPPVQLSVSPTNRVLTVQTVVTVVAEASNVGREIRKLEIFNGLLRLGSATTNFLSVEATIQPGTNDFVAVAYDDLNVARTSTVHRVRGNVPPIVSTSAALGSSTLGLLEPVILRVTATDVDGTVAKVELRVNGQLAATDTSAPFEFNYTPPDFGSYTLVAVAIDKDGATVASGPTRVSFARGADNFSSGVPLLVGTNITLIQSTVGATREKNEPLHAGAAGGKSIWWAWRAPYSGMAVIDTAGSDFDTLLAVYQIGQRLVALTNLVPVAANDDDPWSRPASKVKFSVAAGTTYYIAVDGREGAAGNVKLSLDLTEPAGPINDMLGAAIRWTPIWQGTNVRATKEDGEPAHAGNVGGASIWFRFDNTISTAPVEISTEGSSFDTLLAVYTNAVVSTINAPPFPMSNLRLVASNDDGPGVRTSKLTFTPRSYGTYWVVVDGYNGAEGSVKLQIRALSTLNDPPVRPANDNFATAARLAGGAAVASANARWATVEGGEPRHAGRAAAKSVWWRWTAPTDGTVYVSTKGSEFDTVMAVYRGTRVDALTEVASNDDDPGGLQTSALLFNASAGTEYYIAVGAYDGAVGGPVVLAINQNGFAVVPPRLASQFAEGRLTIRVTDRMGPFVLESSVDLKTWRNVRTMTEAETALIQPMAGAPQQFYRVKLAE